MSKKDIKDAIFDFIYSKTMGEYQKVLDNLIIKNTVLIKSFDEHFVYKNITYSIGKPPVTYRKNRLHESLYPEMDKYLSELKTLNTEEIPYVINFINSVLNTSNLLGDYLHIFPKYVHPPIQVLINQCPCRNDSVSQKDIDTIISKNLKAVEFIKLRITMNLLI